MAKKGSKFKKYSPEFKISCIIDMRNNHLTYSEILRKYFPHLIHCSPQFIKTWERIFLEEGEAGLFIERRGKTNKMQNPYKGHKKKKLPNNVSEEDIISENIRLKKELLFAQAEIEYLKKLDALVRAEEQKKNKKH